MHHMDINKTQKKGRQEPHKNASCCLEKSWKQRLTKLQLYDRQPPISQTIQVRWTNILGTAEEAWMTS